MNEDTSTDSEIQAPPVLDAEPEPSSLPRSMTGWVVLTLLSIGVGVIAYLIAWLIIPQEEDDRAEVISVT